MNELEFDFKEEDSTFLGKIFRPVARVSLENNGKIVPNFFYVDSGADFTTVNKGVGELLGFTLDGSEEIKQAKGISSEPLPIVVKEANLLINESEEIRIKVLWALNEDVPLLLGREGLFDKFDVIFEKNRKTIFRKR